MLGLCSCDEDDAGGASGSFRALSEDRAGTVIIDAHPGASYASVDYPVCAGAEARGVIEDVVPHEGSGLDIVDFGVVAAREVLNVEQPIPGADSSLEGYTSTTRSLEPIADCDDPSFLGLAVRLSPGSIEGSLNGLDVQVRHESGRSESMFVPYRLDLCPGDRAAGGAGGCE